MQHQEHYAALYHILRELYPLQTAEIPRLAQSLLTLTAEALGVHHGCIVLFTPDGAVQDAFAIAQPTNGEKASGSSTDPFEQLLHRGLIGYVRHGQRTVTIRDIRTDTRWPRLIPSAYLPSSGSAVGVPIISRSDVVIAVMLFVAPQVEYFTNAYVKLVEEIGDLGAYLLERAALIRITGEFAAASNDPRRRTVFDDSIIPIILSDLQGYIVDVNEKACEMLGQTADDMLGMPITLVHKIGIDALGEDGLRRLQAGYEIEFKTTATLADGGEIPVIIRARRRLFGSLDVIEWSEQDISDKVALERLKYDLAAMVYHDLRGPLHTVKGSLNALGKHLQMNPNPALNSFLQAGLLSTYQLQRLVDSLLDIQRIEEGKAVLNVQRGLVHDLVFEALQLVQSLAIEAEQRLTFDLPKSATYVNVDRDMIVRVLTNLLENATKYTPAQGTISISARVTPEGIRISIADNGPGIPADMQRSVFDKFSRVKYKDAPSGIGLGLAFCRLAVEAHGGTIWVESEPGNGAEFILTLPLEPEAIAAALPTLPETLSAETESLDEKLPPDTGGLDAAAINAATSVNEMPAARDGLDAASIPEPRLSTEETERVNALIARLKKI